MANLVSVTVTPVNPYILTTQTQQFTAIAHYDDSSTVDVTSNISTTWASSAPSVATINATGLATALSISGATTISATFDSYQGTSILRVGLVNYSRVFEQVVDGTALHNPIVKLSAPNFSLSSGGVTMVNYTGNSSGPIGWTLASGHPGDFAKPYIAAQQQTIGQWVMLDNATGKATTNFAGQTTSLGIVNSISVDINGNALTSGGYPVLVQMAGDAYVSCGTNSINLGDFLVPDASGKVKKTTFLPASPTPIIGWALENSATSTYPNMILMRIQICGD